MEIRPSWDEYFIGIAQQVATRSTCPRANVGSVVTLDNRILGTGYNGSVKGTRHCYDAGCVVADGHCIRTIHAETNAILDALLRGSVDGGTIYCTHQPCVHCSKLIAQVGIKRVVYLQEYPLTWDGERVVEELDFVAYKV